MIKRFIVRILTCTLGIALAAKYVPGVDFYGSLSSLLFAGLVLGTLITFVDPVLKILTFPLRLLTLNLFSLVIDMAIIWATAVLIPDFNIVGLAALFWTAIVVYALNSILWTIFSPLLK